MSITLGTISAAIGIGKFIGGLFDESEEEKRKREERERQERRRIAIVRWFVFIFLVGLVVGGYFLYKHFTYDYTSHIYSLVEDGDFDKAHKVLGKMSKDKKENEETDSTLSNFELVNGFVFKKEIAYYDSLGNKVKLSEVLSSFTSSIEAVRGDVFDSLTISNNAKYIRYVSINNSVCDSLIGKSVNKGNVEIANVLLEGIRPMLIVKPIQNGFNYSLDNSARKNSEVVVEKLKKELK